jgi:hypothetical protein
MDQIRQLACWLGELSVSCEVLETPLQVANLTPKEG